MALQSVVLNVIQPPPTPVEVFVQTARDAYQLAVADGFVGTRAEWEASLIGTQGLSAYQVAVAGGYGGTVEDWLASLIGSQGLSAYQVAVAGGYGGTVEDWLASLIGSQGLNAYQVAVAAGYGGTVEDWLASLIGGQGPAGTITIGNVTTGAAGSSVIITNTGTPEAAVLDIQIPQGAKGDKGDQGDIDYTGRNLYLLKL